MMYSCKCCTDKETAAERHSQRRMFLGLLALSTIAPLAACGNGSGGGSASVAAVDFERGTACDLDGMLLSDFPGPKGQIHFAGAAKPAFFCDTVEVINTLLIPEQIRKVNAVYVQDMGKTDWDKPKGAWIDARKAIYVHGSKRRGSMGATFASFGDEADAQKFVKEWGGQMVRMAEIKPEMVDLRGGAHRDHAM